MIRSRITKEVLDLEALVIRLKRAYYHGTPEVSDAEYDKIEARLAKLYPGSKALKAGTFDPQAETDLFMYAGSLQKVYAEEFGQKWPRFCKDSEYGVFPKFDGYALIAEWDAQGHLEKLTTHDGFKGKDKTYLAAILGIPLHISVDDYETIHVLRMEMILPNSIFEAKYSKDVDPKNGFANPRNALNAIMASKSIHPMVKDVVLIGHHWMHPVAKVLDQQLGAIQSATGFRLGKYKADAISPAVLTDCLRTGREMLDFDIDGVVVIPEHLYNFEFPEHEADPDFMMAFKENTQVCEAEVKDIVWEPTAYGRIFPKLVIKKVKLGGVEIENVTAHHAKFVYANKIGEGTRIVLSRGGDVIPKIERVIEAKGETLEAPSYLYPEWQGVHLRIGAKAGVVDSVQIKRIYQFFKALEIDGVAESLIERMYYDAGMTTIDKVLAASIDDFLGLRKVQLKTATMIHTAIRKGLQNARLDKLMVASCCFEGIGRRLSEKFCDYFDWSVELWKLAAERGTLRSKLLNDIDGVGPEFAEVLFLGSAGFFGWYESVKPFLTEVASGPAKVQAVSAKLAGKSFCFTGFRDDQLEAELVANGGEIKSGVSKKLTYLIVANKNTTSSKAQKARADGILVIDSAEAKALLAS